MRDPAMPTWFYTLPNISFTVPSWIRLTGNGNKANNANGTSGTEPTGVIRPGKHNAPIACYVFDGEVVNRHNSMNRAATEAGIDFCGKTIATLRVKGVKKARNGAVIWTEGTAIPEEAAGAYAVWAQENA